MKKYYPLIDMDSTGTIKVPMFPAYDYKTALRTSNFALGEVSPHHYRLIAVTPHAMRNYLSYDIRCPKCGATMDATEPHEGEYLLAGVYLRKLSIIFWRYKTMTIDTIKERDYAVAMPEYDYAFWNAVKRKPHNAQELKKGIWAENAYFPLRSNSKMTAALKRESVFRSLATIVYLRDPGGIVLAKHCATESCWVPEHGMYTFTQGEGEFTNYNIKEHKLGALLKYDEVFMADVGLDIENHLIDSIARSFGAMEDAAYVNGKGDIQPTGILHSTRGAQVGATAASLTYEDVVKLYFSVKPEYRKHGTWMMNDETAYYLRTLKDEGGNYIWNHTNDTILGKPVRICNDMPSIGVGNKPIAFGDFSYYWIILRDDVSINILKELYYDMGQVGYIAREYLDAKFIRPEAIKVIQVTE